MVIGPSSVPPAQATIPSPLAQSVDVFGPLPRWGVVVPVKGTANAKSRLEPAAGPRRPQLALALALDTLAAAAATPGVRLVVVTGDPVVGAAAREAGSVVVDDPGAGLAAAIAGGIRAARRGLGDHHVAGPDTDGAARPEPVEHPVAVLLGDLPALRPQDLAAALAECARAGSGFVPDAEGTGTVLLAAVHADRLLPAFGAGSAAAHARHATRLDLELPHLRRDVDTGADLAQALTLGVGAHTAALLRDVPQLRPREAERPGHVEHIEHPQRRARPVETSRDLAG